MCMCVNDFIEQNSNYSANSYTLLRINAVIETVKNMKLERFIDLYRIVVFFLSFIEKCFTHFD